MNVEEAAAILYARLSAPRGSVNTLAFVDAAGPLIRVLVDPAAWSIVETVPSVFEGYRVKVERRQPTLTFH